MTPRALWTPLTMTIGLGVAVLVACGDDGGGRAAPTTATSSVVSSTTATSAPPTSIAATSTIAPSTTLGDEVSFASSVLPVVADNCAVCHQPGGPGTGHWQLETVADVVEEHEYLAELVATRVMPPWPASSLSLDFHGDRRLSDDDVAALVSWSRAGAPLDVDPAQAVAAPAPVPALDRVDATLAAAEPYAGSVRVADDYRCFLLDPGFVEERWLTGFEFVPDRTEVVHHAIGYRLPAAARAAGLALDAQDEAPGWPCYGSSGLQFEEDLFLGWAPGQDPSVFPDGAGLPIAAGEFFVLQIHYHYEATAPPDSSQLRLRLADPGAELDRISVADYVAPVEIPCAADEQGPLCDRDVAMADAVERFGFAGVQADRINALCGVTPADFSRFTEGVASSTCDLPVYEFGEVIGILGHEHELGATFRMTLNPDTPGERVLLDIPRWSFDWQLVYRPVERIVLEPGDQLRIECSWDRSLGDPEAQPRYILWADGTDDEMCFSTVTTREPSR